MPRRDLYTGKSGQMAVMAEFLLRGYNVAIPEVDVGDDIFVVRDSDGDLSRIQVKTAHANRTNSGFHAYFRISQEQLMDLKGPPYLYYVFVVRHLDRWHEYLLFRQDELLRVQIEQGLGTLAKGNIVLRLKFTDSDVTSRGVSLAPYRNNWSQWPPIES